MPEPADEHFQDAHAFFAKEVRVLYECVLGFRLHFPGAKFTTSIPRVKSP